MAARIEALRELNERDAVVNTEVAKLERRITTLEGLVESLAPSDRAGVEERVAKLRAEIVQKYVDQDARWIAFNERFNATRPDDSDEKAEARALLKRALARVRGEYATIDETRNAYQRRKKKIVKKEMAEIEQALRSLGETLGAGSVDLRSLVDRLRALMQRATDFDYDGADTDAPIAASLAAQNILQRIDKGQRPSPSEITRVIDQLEATMVPYDTSKTRPGSRDDKPRKTYRSTRRLNYPKDMFDSSDSEPEAMASTAGADDDLIGEEEILTSSDEESYIDDDSDDDADSFIDDDDNKEDDIVDEFTDIDSAHVIENDSDDSLENITLDLAKFKNKSSRGLTDDDADRATIELDRVTAARHKRDARRRPTSFQELYSETQLPDDAPPDSAFTTNAIRFFDRSIGSEQRRLASLQRELANLPSTIGVADSKRYARARRELEEKISQTKQKIRERETNLRHTKEGGDPFRARK